MTVSVCLLASANFWAIAFCLLASSILCWQLCSSRAFVPQCHRGGALAASTFLAVSTAFCPASTSFWVVLPLVLGGRPRQSLLWALAGVSLAFWFCAISFCVSVYTLFLLGQSASGVAGSLYSFPLGYFCGSIFYRLWLFASIWAISATLPACQSPLISLLLWSHVLPQPSSVGVVVTAALHPLVNRKPSKL